jgi:hypothetical protein
LESVLTCSSYIVNIDEVDQFSTQIATISTLPTPEITKTLPGASPRRGTLSELPLYLDPSSYCRAVTVSRELLQPRVLGFEIVSGNPPNNERPQQIPFRVEVQCMRCFATSSMASPSPKLCET